MPNGSSVLSTGWALNAEPAVAPPGWVVNANWLIAAGLMAMVVEVAVVAPAAVKSIVMLVATLWERLVKVTRPATAVRLVVPCNVPLPIPLVRERVTAELLLLVQKLPNWSCKRMTGCWAKATPAIAVAEGWV